MKTDWKRGQMWNQASNCKSKCFKKICLESALNTSCNGIPHLFKTERILLKIAWTICILISTATCVWMVSKSINDYLKFDVITKIQTIQQDEITFPAVMICVDNWNNDSSIFILGCIFDAKLCNIAFESFDYYNLRCLKINGGKNKTQLFSSKISGLNLGLQININIPRNFVAYITLTDNDEKPGINKLANQLFEVKSTVLLKLNKVIDRKLPKPYSECEENINTPLYKEIIDSNIKYTKEYCMTLCACKIYSRNCNCTCPSIYENNLYNDNVCGYQCAIDGYLNGSASECNPQCPLECESTYYQISAYPLANYYSSYLQNVIKFILYFDDSKYTELSQIEKTSLPEIVSIVGGTLGLFLGLSLLSFVEIIDFIIEITLVAKENFKMRAKVKNIRISVEKLETS